MPRSSECTFISPNSDAAKLIRSYELVSKVVVISQQPHSVHTPESSAVKCTLQTALAKHPAVLVSTKRNQESDAFVLYDGKLAMLLTPETFYTFGVPGKKLKNAYLCTVELDSESKLTKRFFECLPNLNTEYEFIYRVDGVKTSIESTCLASTPCPDLHAANLTKDDIDDWSDEFQNWIGLCIAKHAGMDVPSLNSSNSLYVSVNTSIFRSGEICDLWLNLPPSSVLFAEGIDDLNGKKYKERGYILTDNACLKFK